MMTLSELIEFHGLSNKIPTTIKTQYSDYAVSEGISRFLNKFQNSALSEQEFTAFINEISKITNEEIKKTIINIFSLITQNIYYHKCNVDELINNIIANNGVFVGKQPEKNDAYGLLNAYKLTTLMFTDVFCSTYLPFAINALRVAKIIPDTGDYVGLDLGKPFHSVFYPFKQDNISLKQGVKKNEEYMTLKCISKYKANTGDLCFLATNGKKLLYIRHNTSSYKNRSNGIFASKIAKFVSPKHFSSERLLSHGGVGARKLDGYALPLTEYSTRSKIPDYYQQHKKIIPGSGIIDEVCVFIGEHDYNSENLGLSSERLDDAFLSKIDFDICLPDRKGKRIVLDKIYANNSHLVSKDPGYVEEQLFASLKLSFLTAPLVSAIAGKAYCISDSKEEAIEKQKAINACVEKSTEELDFFLYHPAKKDFIENNSKILTAFYKESIEYIQKHFPPQNQKELLKSLKKRVRYIRNEIERLFQNEECCALLDDIDQFLLQSKNMNNQSSTDQQTFEEWDFTHPSTPMIIVALCIPVIGWAYLVYVLFNALTEDNSEEPVLASCPRMA